MKKTAKKKLLNEPAHEYVQTQKLTVFNSFEEMNISDALEMANVPVRERIANTVNLILRAYGITREELNKRSGKEKIVILSRL